MNREELITKWRASRDELARVEAFVRGDKICDLLLQDLIALDEDMVLDLAEAASRSGYSREHLGRLVREGKIPNAGRPNAPRISLRDLPRRAGHLPPERVPEQVSDASKGQIVRSIVDAQRRSSR